MKIWSRIFDKSKDDPILADISLDTYSLGFLRFLFRFCRRFLFDFLFLLFLVFNLAKNSKAL